ncbi:MAG: hypothetical protein Q9P44_20845 [Anaerolineae bacterium]|nr:hypothetical protein [Anaerolineae bacterium]
MINRRFFVLILFFTLLMSVTLVAAQGRGGRGGNGTDRPTRTADDRSGQAQPVGTPSGSFGGTMGDMPFEFELPEDWQNITIPDNLPTSPDDIEAMLADMALPVDLDLESLALGGSSDTAYAGIVGFAQLYLGRSVEPLYADEITTTGSDDLAAALTQVLADLPAELQQIVTSADGIVYWAVLSNGAASVYTGDDCSEPTCTVSIDNLQVNITSASMGVYLLYVDGSVGNSSAAYNLIVQTYPALATYGLTPAESDSGFMFTAYDYALSGSDVSATGAMAGVLPMENGKSLVYALVGVGEGYVALMR